MEVWCSESFVLRGAKDAVWHPTPKTHENTKITTFRHFSTKLTDVLTCAKRVFSRVLTVLPIGPEPAGFTYVFHVINGDFRKTTKTPLWHRLWHHDDHRVTRKGHFLTKLRNRVEIHLVRKCAKWSVRTRPQSDTPKSRKFGVFVSFRCFATTVSLTEVLTWLRRCKHANFGVFRCISVY